MDANIATRGQQNQPEKLDRSMKFKLKQRLRLEIELAGGRQKPVAYAINYDDPAMSRVLSDRCEDSVPAHKMPALTLELGPGLMEWLAIQCGGIYHHGEEGLVLQETPLALVGMLAQLAGRTVQQIVQDFEDNVWSREERQANLPTLRKLKAVVDTLIQDAEGVRA